MIYIQIFAVLTFDVIILLLAFGVMKYNRKKRLKEKEAKNVVYGPLGVKEMNLRKICLYFTSSDTCKEALTFLESTDKQWSVLGIDPNRRYSLLVEGECVENGLLWVLKIPELALIQYEIVEVEQIINKYVGHKNKDIFLCQQSLIDSGLEKWANL